MASRRRGLETVGDMARSLGLVVAVVAVLAAGVAVTQTAREPVPDLDYSEVLEGAGRQAPFALTAPTELPEGWRVTSTRVREAAGGTRWSLGMLTDTGSFVGLEQTDVTADVVEREVLAGFEPDGTVDAGGASWERWAETGGAAADRALSRDAGATTVVLVGTGGYGELEVLAGRLTGTG